MQGNFVAYTFIAQMNKTFVIQDQFVSLIYNNLTDSSYVNNNKYSFFSVETGSVAEGLGHISISAGGQRCISLKFDRGSWDEAGSGAQKIKKSWKEKLFQNWDLELVCWVSQ